MRKVSLEARRSAQVIALRSVTFGLIHRKAMFEYLRDRHVTGVKRQRLLGLFYGSRDVVNSVVAEHGNYLRCAASFLCSCHLAEELMMDAAFAEPFELYEELYGEYFQIFCADTLAETREERRTAIPLTALQPLLKHQLAQARKDILALSSMPGKRWREIEMRMATGDTQKLRTSWTSVH